MLQGQYIRYIWEGEAHEKESINYITNNFYKHYADRNAVFADECSVVISKSFRNRRSDWSCLDIRSQWRASQRKPLHQRKKGLFGGRTPQRRSCGTSRRHLLLPDYWPFRQDTSQHRWSFQPEIWSQEWIHPQHWWRNAQVEPWHDSWLRNRDTALALHVYASKRRGVQGLGDQRRSLQRWSRMLRFHAFAVEDRQLQSEIGWSSEVLWALADRGDLWTARRGILCQLHYWWRRRRWHCRSGPSMDHGTIALPANRRWIRYLPLRDNVFSWHLHLLEVLHTERFHVDFRLAWTRTHSSSRHGKQGDSVHDKWPQVQLSRWYTTWRVDHWTAQRRGKDCRDPDKLWWLLRVHRIGTRRLPSSRDCQIRRGLDQRHANQLPIYRGWQQRRRSHVWLLQLRDAGNKW